MCDEYDALVDDYNELQQKVDKILCLFIDKEIGLAENCGLFTNNDEKFGAMLFASRQFKKAQEILKK